MTSIESVRIFKTTRMELGVDYNHGAWFVFNRMIDGSQWSTHCGPYPTVDDAKIWIRMIVESESSSYIPRRDSRRS